MKKIVFILFALVVMMIDTHAQQYQIIYTGFTPDTCYTLTTTTPDTLKLLDLDQDGSLDIVIFTYFHSAVGGHIVTINANPGWNYSWFYDDVWGPLTDTTVISGPLRWISSGGDPLMYPTNHHFAFRKTTDNGYCYGWAYIYLDLEQSNRTVCVSDMAYCTKPDYPLRWGQTEFTGVEDADNNAFAMVQPNPTNDMVTITGEELSKVEIYNSQGQLVVFKQIENGMIAIDLSGQPAGCYLVKISNRQGRQCVRKVIKH